MSFVAGKNSSTALIFLLSANLIPLFGVLFNEWDVLTVMFLFWLESGVVGFYTLLKMFKVLGPLAVFPSAFLTLHFGGFMAGHLVFILAMFGGDTYSDAWPNWEITLSLIQAVWLPLLALLISHGISFIANFIGKKEYEKLNISKLMTSPYKRIIIMHITIIFGGFLVMALNSPILGLVLLITLKIATDTFAHIKEHSI